MEQQKEDQKTVKQQQKEYDAVIIGGSYAGLSAAMTLGRAMREVLIIDNGKPCNLQTPHSHNFLTQDGSTPAEIAAIGKSQVMAYPTISFMDGLVTEIRGSDMKYRVITESGQQIRARKILFANGIKDLLPDIKGFAACWGISVIHCPYCHGYEYRGQKTGILVNGDMAFDFGRLIRNWTGRLTIFTNGKATISEEQLLKLSDLNINITEKVIAEISHENGFVKELLFTDGSTAELEALYARVPFEQPGRLAESMGCELDEAGYLLVDGIQQTSVPGIYAAGDNCSMFRSVSGAVAAGSKAASVINHQLLVLSH